MTNNASNPSLLAPTAEIYARALHAHLLERRKPTFDHELNNVVHSLLSGTELLAKSLSAESPRVTPLECVALLQQQLARAQTTFAGILDEIAPQAHEPQDVELFALFEDCIHVLRHELQRHECSIGVARELTIRVRYARFRDVLLSLMLHCVERATPKSALHFRASALEGGTRARIAIEFSPLNAAGISETLQLVQSLLSEEGAKLEVRSVDGFESLEIDAPLAPRTDRTAPPIVILDSNRDAADSLALLLQIEGFAAHASYGANSAREAIRSLAPVAVLVDFDGFIDAAAFIRSARDELPAGAQIIALSHSREAPPDAGADRHFAKPFGAAQLRAALESR